MPMSARLIYILLLGLAVISCSKKDESIALFISPETLEFSAAPGSDIIFGYKIQSGVNIRSFSISIGTDKDILKEIYRTSLSGTNVSQQYAYHIADSLQGRKLVFRFSTDNESGNISEELRVVDVQIPYAPPLKETTGLFMYHRSSGKPSGFNLKNVQNVKMQGINPADSGQVDFYDNSPDSSDSITASWRSPARDDFLQANSFDYGNANLAWVISTFNAGIKQKSVDGIKIGDIYLVRSLKNGSYLYSIIRIIDIIDKAGTQDDYYLFSVKQ